MTTCRGKAKSTSTRSWELWQIDIFPVAKGLPKKTGLSLSSKRPSQQVILALLIITAIVLLAPYLGCHILTTAPSSPETQGTEAPARRGTKEDPSPDEVAVENQPTSKSKEGLDEIEQLLGQ